MKLRTLTISDPARFLCLCLSLIALGLAGCTGSANHDSDVGFSSSGGSGYSQSSSIDPASAAIRTMQSDSVTCEGANCNDAIAVLSAIVPPAADSTEWNHQRCTAFLVTPQIMATNSHCIPKDIKERLATNASCHGRIMVHFPATDQKPALGLDCKRVIFASDMEAGTEAGTKILGRNTRAQGDFAYFELMAPVADRAPLAFDFNSIVDDSRVSSPRLHYQIPYFDASSENTGVMRIRNCEASVGVFAIPLLYGTRPSATALVRSLRDCVLPHGSSGSPILNQSGSVVGIHFASITPNVRGFTRASGEVGLDLIQILLRVIALANIQSPPIHDFEDTTFFVASRCLRRTPGNESRPISISCIQRDSEDEVTEAQSQALLDQEERTQQTLAQHPEDSTDVQLSISPATPNPGDANGASSSGSGRTRVDFLKKLLHEELAKPYAASRAFESWRRENSQVFHWGFREVMIPGKPILVYPVPVCIKPVASWQSQYRNHFLFIPTNMSQGTIIPLRTYPIYQLEIAVDRSWITHIRLDNYFSSQAFHDSMLDSTTQESTLLAFSPRDIVQNNGVGSFLLRTLITAITPSQPVRDLLMLGSLSSSGPSAILERIAVVESQDLLSRSAAMRAQREANNIEDVTSQEAMLYRLQYSRNIATGELRQCTAEQSNDPTIIEAVDYLTMTDADAN